jgi:hypothetical protein
MASNRKPVPLRGGVRDGRFRLEIGIDCPMPDYHFQRIREAAEVPDDFENIRGCYGWMWRRGYDDREPAERDREALFRELKAMYADGRGKLRGGFCQIQERLPCKMCGALLPWEGKEEYLSTGEPGQRISIGRVRTCVNCGTRELESDRGDD